MLMIIFVVFIGVFAVAGLLLYASGSGAAQKAKQVQATLESALATESQEMRDQIVNLRKNEQFSAIPWINNRLSKLELGPQLQALIHQANLKWTAGSLLSMCGACFAIPAFAVHWKLQNWAIALLAGLAISSFPILFVLFKRSKRFAAFE
jgi:tight adherence protein B